MARTASASSWAPAPRRCWRPRRRFGISIPRPGRCRRASTMRERTTPIRSAASCARALDLAGPAAVVSSACATTGKAFASAARMIAAGVCDAAIVGGADTLCATTLYGFHSLNVMSDEPCRPFDADRRGISIGEAAGFALLEKPDAADGGRYRAAPRRRREQRRLSHVVAPSGRARRAPRHGARAERRRPQTHRHRLRQPARHGDAGGRCGGGSRHVGPVRIDDALQLDQGIHRPYPRRLGNHRGDLLRAQHPARVHAGQPDDADSRPRASKATISWKAAAAASTG